jgi:hypothetical protein
MSNSSYVVLKVQSKVMLEDNHFDILPDLRQEMWHRKGNRKEIKEIIENQEKLEAWIAEFRCRRTE